MPSERAKQMASRIVMPKAADLRRTFSERKAEMQAEIDRETAEALERIQNRVAVKNPSQPALRTIGSQMTKALPNLKKPEGSTSMQPLAISSSTGKPRTSLVPVGSKPGESGASTASITALSAGSPQEARERLQELPLATIRSMFSLPVPLMRRVVGEEVARLDQESTSSDYVDVPCVQSWRAHRITEAGYQRLVAWRRASATVGQRLNDTQLSAVIAECRVGWARQEFPGAGRSEGTDQKLRTTAKIVQRQWMEHLANFPDWVIRRAFKEYQAEKQFPPQPAEILAHCRGIWPHAALAEKVGALIEQVEDLRPEWAMEKDA